MRKVIVQEWTSLDGFASDRDGSTKFFEDPKYNEGFNEEQLALFARIDAAILGAKTYKMFSEFWPTADAEQEPIAPKLNALHKIVFSKTIKSPAGSRPLSAVMMLLMAFANFANRKAKILSFGEPVAGKKINRRKTGRRILDCCCPCVSWKGREIHT